MTSNISNYSDPSPSQTKLRLYTPNMVLYVSIWGGIPATALLLWLNFRALGEIKKAQLAVILSVILTPLLFSLQFFLSTDINRLVVIPVAIISKYIAMRYYVPGYLKESWWKVLSIGAVLFIVSFAFNIGISFALLN